MTAYVIWLVGVLLTLLFAWFVLRKWMDEGQPREGAVPAWVLPVTGTLNVPIVGNSMRFPGAHEICLASFCMEIIFIIVMMAIIFSRLFFDAPLAQQEADDQAIVSLSSFLFFIQAS